MEKEIIGIGFTKNNSIIKNERTHENEIINEPFIILNSNKKGSLYLMYKTEVRDQNGIRFIINNGYISKENVLILK